MCSLNRINTSHYKRKSKPQTNKLTAVSLELVLKMSLSGLGQNGSSSGVPELSGLSHCIPDKFVVDLL